MLRFGLAVAILLAVAGPAVAQKATARQSSRDVAVSLALDHCPDLISSGKPISVTPELARLGFAGKPEQLDVLFVPGHSWLELPGRDNTIRFGAITGKSCVVHIRGPEAEQTAAATLAQLFETGMDFKKDERNSGTQMDISINVYRHKGSNGRTLIAAFMFKPGFQDQFDPEATFQLLLEE